MTRMKRPLNPHEILQAGTKVQIRNKRGVVVSCDIGDGMNRCNVHTVKLTEKCNTSFDRKWKQMEKCEVWSGNYSFVYVV